MSSLSFSGDAFSRVAISFLLGVSIGNLLWLPYTGALAIAFVLGAIMITAPLATVAGVIAGFADGAIKRHLALSCIVAALAITALYLLFDTPTERAGYERAALAFTCSVASAVTFFVLTKRAKA